MCDKLWHGCIISSRVKAFHANIYINLECFFQRGIMHQRHKGFSSLLQVRFRIWDFCQNVFAGINSRVTWKRTEKGRGEGRETKQAMRGAHIVVLANKLTGHLAAKVTNSKSRWALSVHFALLTGFYLSHIFCHLTFIKLTLSCVLVLENLPFWRLHVLANSKLWVLFILFVTGAKTQK